MPSWKIEKENIEISGSLNILNELNKHFVNISDIIEKTLFSQNNFTQLEIVLDQKLRDNIFEIKYITPYEVRKIIDKLDSGKASGLDGIGPKILKHCGDVITPYIAYIINACIDQCIFPDKLKEARVLPIYKSGYKEDPNNYRPISILPTLSKNLWTAYSNSYAHFFWKYRYYS